MPRIPEPEDLEGHNESCSDASKPLIREKREVEESIRAQSIDPLDLVDRLGDLEERKKMARESGTFKARSDHVRRTYKNTLDSMLRYAPEQDREVLRERMVETLAAVLGTPNFAVWDEMARWVFDSRENARGQGGDVPDHMSFRNDSNGKILPAPPGILTDMESLQIKAFNKAQLAGGALGSSE